MAAPNLTAAETHDDPLITGTLALSKGAWDEARTEEGGPCAELGWLAVFSGHYALMMERGSPGSVPYSSWTPVRRPGDVKRPGSSGTCRRLI